MDQLLFSLALEDSTPSGSPLPSFTPVTKPLFAKSSAFSSVPPGGLIPLRLPEPFPPRPSILCLNPRTPFGNFPSPSPLVHSLPPERFPPLESKFPADHSLFQPLDLPSPPPHDSHSADAAVQPEDPLTLNTIFLDSSMTQDINPLLQSLSQSQPLSLTQIQPQAHLHSSRPILSCSSTHQIKSCGVYFHSTQNESDCLNSSQIQHLEWNVLRKHQESLWGLPPMVQKSEEFCSLTANNPYCQSLSPCLFSIFPVKFPLSNELWEKLEHLKERLIQHQWGLPHRIHEFLPLMSPLAISLVYLSNREIGLSCISLYKGQSSENLNTGLSQPESFSRRSSKILQLEEEEGKDEKHSPENHPKDYLLNDSESASEKDVVHDSEKDLASYMSLSGENSMILGQSINQTMESVLKMHLSKKFEGINESHLPGTVHSW
ncbi:LOW QUALITY PROTEIN: spermatogenesis-associated protein 31D3-like [Glossophaga mutica]